MNTKNDYRGLSLVSAGPRNSSPPSRASRFHVEKMGYVADVFVSSWSEGEIYHYIIQPVGSREIVHWGQEPSLQRAKDCVQDFLSDRKKRQA